MKTIWVLTLCVISVGGRMRAAENEPVEKGPERVGAIREVFFDGGTVRQLVERLRQEGRKANPPAPPLNVIVPDDLQDEYVPKFELHNVTYSDIFIALSSLRSPRQPIWFTSGNGAESVWALRAENPLPAGKPKISQVFQLQPYLGKYKIEDITTAIQTAWEMLGDEKSAQLKYHKDTSLLIAVGSQTQLSAISQVLHSLVEGLEATAAAARKKSGEVFVNGAVNKAGTIILTGEQDLDILGAIARAGGLTVRANENRIKLTRPGVMEKTLSLDDLKKGTKFNLLMQPGDIIEVAEKLF